MPLIHSIDDFNYQNKTVLLRLDINSPIDPVTKTITNTNRIDKSLATINDLADQGGKVVILAHQGDTLDYQNLIPLTEHCRILTERLGKTVQYIDDVAGPAARELVKGMKPGEIVLLGNLRYLAEEISSFEDVVPLKANEMLDTYLVRQLAPLADYYVNDAFAAAHRNAPSMVAFQELLPSAGGRQLVAEFEALRKVSENPERPALFVLGGLKVSDAFGMLGQVLKNGTADAILAGGVTGILFQMARGISFGRAQTQFVNDRGLQRFVEQANGFLTDYEEKFILPIDFAYECDGLRHEAELNHLPDDVLYLDLGRKSINLFQEQIARAGTIFINGPVGAYEHALFATGTDKIWNAMANAPGYTVVGGGDSVSAAYRFVSKPEKKFNYICTAGGAMVRFLSNQELPLITALKKAYGRF